MPRTARAMQWLLAAHVRRYHKHHHTAGSGHIRQGRFEAFGIQRGTVSPL